MKMYTIDGKKYWYKAKGKLSRKKAHKLGVSVRNRKIGGKWYHFYRDDR